MSDIATFRDECYKPEPSMKNVKKDSELNRLQKEIVQEQSMN
jgi:hypothetical protein